MTLATFMWIYVACQAVSSITLGIFFMLNCLSFMHKRWWWWKKSYAHCVFDIWRVAPKFNSVVWFRWKSEFFCRWFLQKAAKTGHKMMVFNEASQWLEVFCHIIFLHSGQMSNQVFSSEECRRILTCSKLCLWIRACSFRKICLVAPLLFFTRKMFGA